MFIIYLALASVLTPILHFAFDLFNAGNFWYMIPLIFAAQIAIFFVLQAITVVLMTLFVNLKKEPRDTFVYRFLIIKWVEMVVYLMGVRIHATGLEKVPQRERFLLVCNHIHDLDPVPIYIKLFEKRLAFIGKKEVEKLFPFVFKIMHKMHGLPIDRENNREAAKTIINATRLIKSGECSVAVFPEGYVKGGELQPLRNGSLKIATKSGAKIVVCSLVGTRDITKNMFRRKTHVYFDVLDVIETKDNPHTAELGDQIHEMMRVSIESHKK